MMETPPTRNEIFLISDSAEVRRCLSSSTSEMPIYIPSQRISNEEVFALLSRVNPRLIIVDLSFQGESGSQLIRQLTARQSSPLILAVSPRQANHAVRARRALIAGATGYLTRDELPDELERAVRRMTAGDIFLSEETKEMLYSPLHT